MSPVCLRGASPAGLHRKLQHGSALRAAPSGRGDPEGYGALRDGARPAGPGQLGSLLVDDRGPQRQRASVRDDPGLQPQALCPGNARREAADVHPLPRGGLRALRGHRPRAALGQPQDVVISRATSLTESTSSRRGPLGAERLI